MQKQGGLVLAELWQELGMLILMVLPFASLCPLLLGMVAMAQLLLDCPSLALSSLLGNTDVAEPSPLVVVRSSALLWCVPLP